MKKEGINLKKRFWKFIGTLVITLASSAAVSHIMQMIQSGPGVGGG